MAKNYEDLKEQIRAKVLEQERMTKQHLQTLKSTLAEKKNNGGCAEYSNMTVSIFNSEHLNNEAKKS